MEESTTQLAREHRRGMPEPEASSISTPSLSRRGFIGRSGAVGGIAAAAIVAGGPRAIAVSSRLQLERTVILQLARAGVTFPLALPAYNEPGPPGIRALIARIRAARRRLPPGGIALAEHHPATMSQLVSAERRMPAGDLARARAGADLLIAAGLPSASLAAMLEEVGRQAAGASQRQRRELVAAVTLAIATVFPGFDPASTTPASQWLSVLAIMYRAGTLRPALARRGIR